MNHDYWYEHNEEAYLRAEKILEELRARRQAEIERVENALMGVLSSKGGHVDLTPAQMRSFARLITAEAPAVREVLGSTNLGYVPYWARPEVNEPASKED